MVSTTEHIRVKVDWDGQAVSRGVDQAGRDFGRFRKSVIAVNGAMETLSNLGAGVALVEIGRRAIGAALEMEKLAAKSDRMSAAFQALAKGAGGNAAKLLTEIKTAASGTVSNIQALTLANTALSANIPGLSQNMGQLVKDVRAVSSALGRDSVEDINRVISAINKQEQELLDELGIVARVETALKKYSEATGIAAKNIDEAGKRQAFFNLVLGQLREKAESVGVPLDNAATASERLAAAWSDMQESGGKLVESGGVVDLLTKGVRELESIFKSFEENGDKGPWSTIFNLQSPFQYLRHGTDNFGFGFDKPPAPATPPTRSNAGLGGAGGTLGDLDIETAARLFLGPNAITPPPRPQHGIPNRTVLDEFDGEESLRIAAESAEKRRREHAKLLRDLEELDREDAVRRRQAAREESDAEAKAKREARELRREEAEAYRELVHNIDQAIGLLARFSPELANVASGAINTATQYKDGNYVGAAISGIGVILDGIAALKSIFGDSRDYQQEYITALRETNQELINARRELDSFSTGLYDLTANELIALNPTLTGAEKDEAQRVQNQLLADRSSFITPEKSSFFASAQADFSFNRRVAGELSQAQLMGMIVSGFENVVTDIDFDNLTWGQQLVELTLNQTRSLKELLLEARDYHQDFNDTFKRSVGLEFDAREIALRQSLVGQAAGVGSDQAGLDDFIKSAKEQIDALRRLEQVALKGPSHGGGGGVSVDPEGVGAGAGVGTVVPTTPANVSAADTVVLTATPGSIVLPAWEFLLAMPEPMVLAPEDILDIPNAADFTAFYTAPGGLGTRMLSGLEEVLAQYRTNLQTDPSLQVNTAAGDYITLPDAQSFNDLYRDPGGLGTRMLTGLQATLTQYKINVRTDPSLQVNTAASDYITLPSAQSFNDLYRDPGGLGTRMLTGLQATLTQYRINVRTDPSLQVNTTASDYITLPSAQSFNDLYRDPGGLGTRMPTGLQATLTQYRINVRTDPSLQVNTTASDYVTLPSAQSFNDLYRNVGGLGTRMLTGLGPVLTQYKINVRTDPSLQVNTTASDYVTLPSAQSFNDLYRNVGGLGSRMLTGLGPVLTQYKTNIQTDPSLGVTTTASDYITLPASSSFNDLYRKPGGLGSRMLTGLGPVLAQYKTNIQTDASLQTTTAPEDFVTLPTGLEFWFSYGDMLGEMTTGLSSVLGLYSHEVAAEKVSLTPGDFVTLPDGLAFYFHYVDMGPAMTNGLTTVMASYATALAGRVVTVTPDQLITLPDGVAFYFHYVDMTPAMTNGLSTVMGAYQTALEEEAITLTAGDLVTLPTTLEFFHANADLTTAAVSGLKNTINIIENQLLTNPDYSFTWPASAIIKLPTGFDFYFAAGDIVEPAMVNVKAAFQPFAHPTDQYATDVELTRWVRFGRKTVEDLSNYLGGTITGMRVDIRTVLTDRLADPPPEYKSTLPLGNWLNISPTGMFDLDAILIGPGHVGQQLTDLAGYSKALNYLQVQDFFTLSTGWSLALVFVEKFDSAALHAAGILASRPADQRVPLDLADVFDIDASALGSAMEQAIIDVVNDGIVNRRVNV